MSHEKRPPGEEDAPRSSEAEREVPNSRSAPTALDRALSLVEYLRRECPWDRKQTARSLVPHLLEESREVADAVFHGSSETLKGELGDLLLNVAFQIVVAEEEGRFGRAEVVRTLEEKMRRRHPHLFGQGGEPRSWESVKEEETEQNQGSVLEGIAPGLDPLLRAHRVQARVSRVGFDWAEPRGALAKVAEELAEVERALESESAARLEEELGDLLFAVVNLTRIVDVHAAVALEGANAKFHSRFQRLEALAREREVVLGNASLEALDRLWDQVKEDEGKKGD